MKRIQSGSSFPERMEIHEKANWYDLGFNHKTTLSMGMLVPLATKEVYPGERVRLGNEIKLMFAALLLPIMHQCYFTCDWYYVANNIIWDRGENQFDNWQNFIKADPNIPPTAFPTFDYKRALAIYTDGVLNYMGFNAPPGSGTLILETKVSALPPVAYAKIWNDYYRNDQIQPDIFAVAEFLKGGDNTGFVEQLLPDLRVLRRNWPRDYYTSATPTPQNGENVLIPSFHVDEETGLFKPQKIYKLTGENSGFGTTLGGEQVSGSVILYGQDEAEPMVLQLSSTYRDFRYSAKMTEFLERGLRSGDRYVDFVVRNFGYNPNPLYIDRPVWIGGYTGDVFIQEVLATAEVGAYTVGEYAGQAIARDNTPTFEYLCPDYGFVMCMFTVYPKASYYSGQDRMWSKLNKMDYMWEQFALIGDQPIRNKEVWFSWYSADNVWNNEIFGYLPQYTWEKYSNDIVSGQMRTIWEGFHLGRKFVSQLDVVLNSTFLECRPDIQRVFVVDAEAGEHECLVHAYNKIEILRRLPKNAIPQT